MKCLHAETLERLSLGFLADEKPVRDHLAACPPCRRHLAALRQEHAALAEAARALPAVQPRRAPRPVALLWKPLAWAVAVHAVLLGGFLAYFCEPEEPSVDLVQVSPDATVRIQEQEPRIQNVYRPADQRLRHAPLMDTLPTDADEPLTFYPAAAESDHLESADNEDYRSMKGESQSTLGYVLRPSSRLQGAFDTLGVGGGGVGPGGSFVGRMGVGNSVRDRRQITKGYRPVPGVEGDQGMTFKNQGTNPFVQTADERLSTFGLDVDTASYTKARNFLLLNAMPPKEAVRVEEFVNYFRYADPQPATTKFEVRLEAAPSPFNEGRHLLRIGVQSRDFQKDQRPRAVMTFVIDVSGSMARGNRLQLVKQSLALLVDQLRKDDQVGIVVYGSTGRRLLDPTPVVEKERILDVIRGLRTEGATNLEDGVNIGYELAAANFDRRAANRVIICTDGVANNGVTDPVVLLRNVKEKAESGIWLSVFGFGMDNYNDALMSTLADKGNGNYAYIDDFQEAQKQFIHRLGGLFDVGAADAKVQVEFNPATVTSYRLIGYEKRKLENEDFRNDKVDAGDLSSGHRVTALYEMTLDPGATGRLAAVRLRYKVPSTKEIVETEDTIGSGKLRKRYQAASPSFRLAATVAQFAEILRGSPHVTNRSFEPVLDAALVANADLDRPEDSTELVALIRQAIKLTKK